MRILLLLTLFATLPASAASEWIDIKSTVFRAGRSLLVDLPDSYAEGERRYPVLYVMDATFHAFHAAATAKALSDNGRMPEVIVVGVRHEDRIRELTPTRVAEATVEGEVLPFPTSGGAGALRTFLETEVIPEIEKRYRTEPHRILAGHSFGGMFALDTLLARPGLFQTVIAISPTVWWDDRYLIRRVQAHLQSKAPLPATLVLAAGEEFPAMNEPFAELEKLLASPPKGLKVHTFHFEEEDHYSTAVPGFYSALRRVFAPWFFKLEGDTATMWPRLQAHAEMLSKRYGYKVLVPEERANQIGYKLLRAKRLDEARKVFEAVVAAYPNSPNAHDSLGDAYDTMGDVQRAWQSYEQGVMLARSAQHKLLPAFESKLAAFKRRNPMLFPPAMPRR
jgi:uncharacterized protein